MTNSIRSHPKHGINPSLMICFWCGEGSNGIALLGHNRGKEAPRFGIYDYEPCDKCIELMSQGITFIEAEKTPVFSEQPELSSGVYPTGSFWVLKEEAVRRILKEDTKFLDNVMEYRKCCVTPEMAIMLNLKQEKEEVNTC